MSKATTPQPLWTPSAERAQNSRLQSFIDFAKENHPEISANYEELHRWSIEHKETFWKLIWEYFQVKGVMGDSILEQPRAMPGAHWFPQASMNFAENLLARPNNSTAIISYKEDGTRYELSWPELKQRVSQLAYQLKTLGITKGDRVAAFVPNSAESVIGMLATTSLGAVWSSCSPDFGFQGVMDRFGQIEPKILLACNGYQYNGKTIDTRQKVGDIAASLSSLQALIWITYVDTATLAANKLSDHALLCLDLYSDIYTLDSYPTLSYTPCKFNDPLYIMFSSGTTGVPKCIVHGIGGTLLQHLKELGLHTDLREGDRIFYFTTCGWMMWNWVVSSLALGATLVTYDGSPFYPAAIRLFDIAENEKLNIFGAGAKFYSACEKAHLAPIESHDLSQLRALLSTGSPLPHETFDYLYGKVKGDICLSSISGGTDILSCFALGNPTLPVYRGELQCLGLGMDVHFVNDLGEPVIGERGELACLSPFPSMPIGFWNDADNKKYLSAYFESYPGIWAHGDFGEIVEHQSTEVTPKQKGVIIHGRSDAVLNPGGVRIGTAEIYRQVEKLDWVLESIAVGQQFAGDERIVLFVKLRPGVALGEQSISEIKSVIRSNTTPRHVPAKVISVADIPRTISGKIVELAVKNVIHGKEVKNKEALANPEALEYFVGLKELEH